MATTSQNAVARIAYLASDIVLDVLPRDFSPSLYQPTFSSSVAPNIISVRYGADPGSILLARKDAGITSLTASSSKDVLRHLIPHLSELSSRSLVLHVAVNGDLSDALALRSSIPFVLHSSSAQQAHDHALLASRIARLEHKAVLHIFHVSHAAEGVSQVEAETVKPFLESERRHSRTNSTHNALNGFNGHSNGANWNENGNDSGSEPFPLTPSSLKHFNTEDDPALFDLFKAYEFACLDTLVIVRRALRPLSYSGPAHASTLLFTLGSTTIDVKRLGLPDVASVQVSLLSPLPSSKILASIPTSVSRILLLEQLQNWPTRYSPLFLDIVTAVQQRTPALRPTVTTGILGAFAPDESPSSIDVQKLLQNPTSKSHLGRTIPILHHNDPVVQVPPHETAYIKILTSLFSERLQIENAPDRIEMHGDAATRPEFALGRVRAQLEAREELIQAVRDLLRPNADAQIPHDLAVLLSKWLLAKDDGTQSRLLADQIIPLLSSAPRLQELQTHFSAPSRWIIGSDVWSHDLGASGLHHLLSSSLNINLLLLDTLPYTKRDASPAARLKKDAGLYAMNHGDAYVASVAVYSSYGQVLQALAEADKYPGPSVVLAYLPYEFGGGVEVGALQVLKETKLAVDAGYWPLYRWDPAKERQGKEPFSLDSEALKADLEQFLERQNHLSQLVRSTPDVAADLIGGLGDSLKEVRWISYLV